MSIEYSWLPFFEELLANICRNYNGKSLYHIWTEIFPDDYKDIMQMDPFTLIGVSMARGDEQKKEYCKKLKEKFNLNASIPDDFDGIPSLMGSNPYFCRECSIRIANGENADDVYTNIMKPLWNLANQVNNEKIEEKDYNTSINFKPNGPAKLTQVIFMCKPKKFYSGDSNNIDYLNLKTGQKFKLEKNFNSFMAFQNEANNIEQKPYIFSYKAYQNSKKIKSNNGRGENMNLSKNLILYGPPGTGKTYNTVVKAMSIIDGKNYEYDESNNNYRNDKDELRVKYDDLLERFQEQINKKSDDITKQIEFVTFHQSYSYEEFVEGIKPDLDNSELKYIREDGIFKKICDNANARVTNDFEQIYTKFIEEFDENHEFQTSKSSFKVRINEKDGLTIRTGDNFDVEKSGTITKDQIKNQIYTSEGRKKKLEIITKYLQDNYGLKFNQNKQDQNYVIIIDEINRGDVSKIFGELITLIEEDKRVGNKHQMKITLPYSKESFGVPNNLYIIGTMNTADRSIALLDTALRRRFDFEEIPPNPELLKEKKIIGTEINPKALLTNLNNRIEEYLDKDHKLGHSYLMGIETKDQLEKAYKNRILPLLNEYFYNDSETVGKVLNCKKYETTSCLDVLKETQKEYKRGLDDQE